MRSTFFIAFFALSAASVLGRGCPVYIPTRRSSANSKEDSVSEVVEDIAKQYESSSGKLPSIINVNDPRVPFYLPSNFFNRDIKRGGVLRAKGGRIIVSDAKDERLRKINAHAAHDLSQVETLNLTFFTPVFDNKIIIEFRVPGTNVRGSVGGFAAVFVDVDKPNTSLIRYLDKDDCLISERAAEEAPRGRSVVGISDVLKVTEDEIIPESSSIAKVEIILGDTPLRNKRYRQEGKDIVVLDAILFSRPGPIAKGQRPPAKCVQRRKVYESTVVYDNICQARFGL